MDTWTKYTNKPLGKPISIAKSAIKSPRIDIVLYKVDFGEAGIGRLFMTRGMNEKGLAELMTATWGNAKWSSYFLLNVCYYCLEKNYVITPGFTYESVPNIDKCGRWKIALLDYPELIGLKSKELVKELGLKRRPLYLLPITRTELNFSLKHGVEKLLRVFGNKAIPTLSNLSRQSAV